MRDLAYFLDIILGLLYKISIHYYSEEERTHQRQHLIQASAMCHKIKRNVIYMSLLRNKTAEEITSFIQGWLEAIDANNDELNDHNAVFRALRDILEYACPNEFGKTDDKQETAENVNYSPTNEELISSLIARPEDLRVKSNDVQTVNIKDDGTTSEDYNMTFEDAQAYCSERGIDIP